MSFPAPLKSLVERPLSGAQVLDVRPLLARGLISSPLCNVTLFVTRCNKWSVTLFFSALAQLRIWKCLVCREQAQERGRRVSAASLFFFFVCFKDTTSAADSRQLAAIRPGSKLILWQSCLRLRLKLCQCRGVDLSKRRTEMGKRTFTEINTQREDNTNTWINKISGKVNNRGISN